MAEHWDLAPGDTPLRSELHDRWGGARRGGMEPAPRAESVFLFTNPRAGEAFGYVHDAWQPDGSFHYTGDGPVGDQSPDVGGSRALLKVRDNGRSIRLFHSTGTRTTYVGAFELAHHPRTDSLGADQVMRPVMVFRLLPVDARVVRTTPTAPAMTAGAVVVPLEAADTSAFESQHPDEPTIALLDAR